MQYFTIPTTDDPESNPFYKQSCTLDGKVYVLRFQYNQRQDVWYLSIFFEDELVLGGLKLLPGPLVTNNRKANCPAGEFFVLSPTDEVPGLKGLGEGRTAQLLYVPSETLADVQANG